MMPNHNLVRARRRRVTFAFLILGLLTISTAHAQSSGPTVNECNSGVVDWQSGVEETVCLYGDQNGLTAYAEVDDSGSSNGYYADAVGLDAFITGGTSWDSGDLCCSSSEYIYDSLVPQLNVWYTLGANYDEDFCYVWDDCSWEYTQTGLSVSVEVTPSAPSVPTGLAATAGNGQVSLSWTGSANATSYNVYEGSSPSGEGSTPIVTGVSGTTYNVNGLTNGNAYYFTVAAVNSYGTSGYSNETNATPEPPPPAPIELGASAGNAQVLLSWVDDPGTNSYQVYRGTSPGGESSSPIATGVTGTEFTVTGLANGTAYYFTVAAVDSFGTSTYSNEASATPSGTGSGVYSYSINQYDSVGNVKSYSDSVNGSWNFTAVGNASGYDTLNRLSLASWTPVSGSAESFCWTYDHFGNRTTEATSNQAFVNNSGATSCQVASGATLLSNDWALYTVDGTINTGDNGKNQLRGTPNGIYQYDNVGDVLNDASHAYAYDGEGQICAVAATPLNGGSGVTQYLYDAEGTRVAKGLAHPVLVNGVYVLSCDTTQNGFSPTNTYILGPKDQQLTELASSDGGVDWTWAHTNVWAAGQLIATYSPNGTGSQAVLNFHLTDWLGTRRVLTDYAGTAQQTCQSLPYGDGETCPTTPTEHLFTGKERDSESGNDYFDARYYASSMGRFLSPDWAAQEEPVPYANLDDPQSLNLYAYVENNPLFRTDPDGHCCWDQFRDFMDGASGAYMGDEGAGRMAPDVPSSGAGKGGALFGHSLALAQSGLELVVGTTAAVGGGGEAVVTSPAAATGVGAVIPGAGVAVAAAGAALDVHGAVTGIKAAGNILAMALNKSKTGPGSVPKEQRAKQRVASDKERTEMRNEQGGNCAHCDKPLGGDEVSHHYPERHADGGTEQKLVHSACHTELHGKC